VKPEKKKNRPKSHQVAAADRKGAATVEFPKYKGNE
jgi:hypothetical protein